MPKVQDLFKRADGSKILDTKLLMTIQDIPAESVSRDLSNGTTISVYPLKLSHQGQTFDLELNQDQLTRIFTKTTKAGDVTWQAKVGDTVNFWYASNKKSPTRPYFDAELAEAVANEGVAAAEDVFNLGAPPASTPPAPKKQFVKTGGRGEDVKWDGTPRQSSFRQGYAGMIQAILCNPAINPKNPEDVEFAKSLAKDMVKEVRVESKNLEASIAD